MPGTREQTALRVIPHAACPCRVFLGAAHACMLVVYGTVKGEFQLECVASMLMDPRLSYAAENVIQHEAGVRVSFLPPRRLTSGQQVFCALGCSEFYDHPVRLIFRIVFPARSLSSAKGIPGFLIKLPVRHLKCTPSLVLLSAKSRSSVSLRVRSEFRHPAAACTSGKPEQRHPIGFFASHGGSGAAGVAVFNPLRSSSSSAATVGADPLRAPAVLHINGKPHSQSLVLGPCRRPYRRLVPRPAPEIPFDCDGYDATAPKAEPTVQP
ncbi:hypothetical protein B0H10DRAFT_2362362 [Mycena sp. CBHHK59/15]|nr:hypothetical protein B0H10DRAFT_2362362 [Mycena sp. CBHHK59/15]